MRVPSGDQAGSRSIAVVSRLDSGRGWRPSAFIVQMRSKYENAMRFPSADQLASCTPPSGCWARLAGWNSDAIASAPALIEARSFAINVLQTEQQPASITFSTRVEDRFGTTPWSTGEAGAPILKDSLCVFECDRYAVYDGGDHHILVGQVVKASFDASLDPLLFFRGSYRRLHFD